MSTNHTWKFFRAGGFDQVRLETGADLMALDQLDQKLWVALACPTTGLEFDKVTLALIDTDKDGRIRAPEGPPPPRGGESREKTQADFPTPPPPRPRAPTNAPPPEAKILLFRPK